MSGSTGNDIGCRRGEGPQANPRQQIPSKTVLGHPPLERTWDIRVGGKRMDPRSLGRSRSQRTPSRLEDRLRGGAASSASPARSRGRARAKPGDTSQRSLVDMWEAKKKRLQEQREAEELEESPQRTPELGLTDRRKVSTEKVAPTPAGTESSGNSQDCGPKGGIGV